MATYVYEQTPGALIAGPERSVSTYPSGLVRVDQVYMGATASAAAHRAQLATGSAMPDGNDSPAVDGLYIFPHVPEIQRGDGFNEYRVSAFGRTVKTIQNLELRQKMLKSWQGVRFFVWEVSGTIVVPYGTAIDYDDLGLDESLLTPFDATYLYTGYALLDIVYQEERQPYTMAQWMAFLNNQTVLFPDPESDQAIEIPEGYRKTRRRYRFRFTADGTTAARTFDVWVDRPAIKVSAQRFFGKWVEMDIVTERENTTDEVV